MHDTIGVSGTTVVSGTTGVCNSATFWTPHHSPQVHCSLLTASHPLGRLKKLTSNWSILPPKLFFHKLSNIWHVHWRIILELCGYTDLKGVWQISASPGNSTLLCWISDISITRVTEGQKIFLQVHGFIQPIANETNKSTQTHGYRLFSATVS